MVGTSGSPAIRSSVVTASARILPALIGPIAKVPSMTMKSSVPSSTSGSASGAVR